MPGYGRPPCWPRCRLLPATVGRAIHSLPVAGLPVPGLPALTG